MLLPIWLFISLFRAPLEIMHVNYSWKQHSVLNSIGSDEKPSGPREHYRHQKKYHIFNCETETLQSQFCCVYLCMFSHLETSQWVLNNSVLLIRVALPFIALCLKLVFIYFYGLLTLFANSWCKFEPYLACWTTFMVYQIYTLRQK